MEFTRRSFFVAWVACAALAACGGGRHDWLGQPAAAGGIQINVDQAYVNGPRLFVRTTFINGSTMPIAVNRDAVVLVLPNGQIVPRSAGQASLHGIYIIPPGAAHQVHVDFFASGFHWREMPGAQVNWSNAVTLNGAPIAMPVTQLIAR